MKTSAGILPYRLEGDKLEVLIGHPGGPFWAKKDLGAWSVVKGELGEGEDALAAARREFAEETGVELSGDDFVDLGEVTQRAGKMVRVWGYEQDVDPAAIVSNTIEIEWPPRSGRTIEIPEIDRVEWFCPGDARVKLNAAQVPFVDRLEEWLAS